MATYHFHIAANQHDPFPPLASLPAIEAASPEAALERLKAAPYKGPAGLAKIWLRVIVESNPNGTAKRVLAKEVTLSRVDKND